MKNLPCPVCSTPAAFVQHHPEADLYRCTTCDHCFSDVGNMSSQEGYGPDYYEEVHRNWFENPNTELFELIYKEITRFNPKASLIDLGCGKADFLKFLQTRNKDLSLTGIDFTPNDPVEGITLLQGDAFAMKFDHKFDVVTNLAVIEHVADVQRFTQRLIDLCEPDGLVIIMTINDRSILYEVGRALHRVGLSGPFTRLYSKHHLNHFNIASLRRLVESRGLKVLKTLHHNTPMNAVDFPAPSALARTVMRMGVRGTFALGRLTGRTFLQTIVCQKDGRR